MSPTHDDQYILDRSDAEVRRLVLQASILEPFTRRLLGETGVAPGVRVLDVGAGACDVSLLAAGMVGPDGGVTALDIEDRALDTGRRRAREAGVDRIRFVHGTLDELPPGERFDVVIGRYVLVHQSDAVALIRQAASFLRPGGRLAFEEPFSGNQGDDVPPLRSQVWREIDRVMRSLPQYRCGPRFTALFHDAGLPAPTVFSETPVGNGPDSPLLRWIALTHASLRPFLDRAGMGSAVDTADPEDLWQRLRNEVSARDQFMLSAEYCAWATVGEPSPTR